MHVFRFFEIIDLKLSFVSFLLLKILYSFLYGHFCTFSGHLKHQKIVLKHFKNIKLNAPCGFIKYFLLHFLDVFWTFGHKFGHLTTYERNA